MGLSQQQQQQQATARASCCQLLHLVKDLHQWQQQQLMVMLMLSLDAVSVLRVGLLQRCCYYHEVQCQLSAAPVQVPSSCCCCCRLHPEPDLQLLPLLVLRLHLVHRSTEQLQSYYCRCCRCHLVQMQDAAASKHPCSPPALTVLLLLLRCCRLLPPHQPSSSCWCCQQLAGSRSALAEL
jgi:hypothetical protein